jgi:hypothetical protein
VLGVLLVLAALLLVNFLLFALTRRLNFDESLALHAGWLSFNGVPAQPFFYMPFSLVLGWLAPLIEDPGRLFVTLRLAAVLSLLLVLLLLVWRLGLKGWLRCSLCCYSSPMGASSATAMNSATILPFYWAGCLAADDGVVAAGGGPGRRPLLCNVLGPSAGLNGTAGCESAVAQRGAATG